MDKKDYTLIWLGPIYNLGGYGQVTRNFIKGLYKKGVRIKIVPFSDDSLDENKFTQEEVKMFRELEKTPIVGKGIVILNIAPGTMEYLKIKNAHVIMYTIFETDTIPKDWVKILNSKFIDEVWVPTKFNMETVSKAGISREKLYLMPYGIDLAEYNIKPNKKSKNFRFLYIAVLIPRKNIPQLIEAFIKEFKNEENVELFLHVHQRTNDERQLNELRSKYGNLSNHNVIISKQKLSTSEIKELIASCDVYISVDRANGWGMPCMEAMAMKRPAITINWSGSTEFMNEHNSFLIPISGLEPITAASKMHPIYIGHKMATVSERDIRKIMREAYENRKKREEIAREGYLYIKRNLTIDIMIEKLLARLSSIDAKQNEGPVEIKIKKNLLTEIKIMLNYIVHGRNYHIIQPHYFRAALKKLINTKEYQKEV